MLGFIKEKLKKVYNQFTTKVATLFSRNTIDQAFFDELTELLICADTGIKTTNKIMDHIKKSVYEKGVTNPQDIKVELEQKLYDILQSQQIDELTPNIILLVGINGSGKTTFAGKLAHKLKSNGKKVLLVAGDTFRAAATEQLAKWGNTIGVDVFIGKENQDPASVVFDGCKKYLEEGYDHIIVDTAGRLQTKVNLMKELTKIRRIIEKKIPEQTIHTWLTIDAMLGQNSFEQAKLFNEATDITGIILTKFDGTGKGGIVFSITDQLKLPIAYVTFGEKLDALKVFDAKEYVHELLGE